MGEGEQQAGERADVGGSQERQTDGEAYFPDLPLGAAWGESIPKERAAELEARLQAWERESDHGKQRGPVDGVTLTGADVYWLAARSLVSSGNDDVIAMAKTRLVRSAPPTTVPHLHLEGAQLFRAHLERALLIDAHLEEAFLREAHLEQADLGGAHLERADVVQGHLEGTSLHMAYLEDALLNSTHLEGAYLVAAHLEHARLGGAYFHRANLSYSRLDGARLSYAHLEGADLQQAHLEGANLVTADLSGADLRAARMNIESDLTSANLSPSTHLADVIWNAVPMATVAWERLQIVGDETQARMRRDANGKKKNAATRLREYEGAVRAYRLLSVALRSQGLNEHADRYAFRAQLMQRVVLRRQAFSRQRDRRGGYFSRLRKLTAYCGSWFLAIIAGYGYRPGRSIFAYLTLVSGFAVAYFLLGAPPGHLGTYHTQWYEALVVSLTAFHGRGFFAQQYSPGDPQSVLAAIEAVVGLLIEITFIATFTNRFFAR